MPDFYLAKFTSELVPVNANLQLPSNPVFAIHPYGKSQPLNVSVCVEAIAEHLQNLMSKS